MSDNRDLEGRLSRPAPSWAAADVQRKEAAAEIARLAVACLSKEAAIEDLSEMLAEMQDDLDAAHRLLGLAPYPLTA